MSQNIIYVVDDDARRANSVCQAGSQAVMTALPFENTHELAQRWPNEGFLLVPDEGQHFDDALEVMRDTGCALPILKYGANPTTAIVAEAMLNGAAAFLEYPVDPEELRQSIESLRTRWARLVARNTRAFDAAKRVAALSPRETEVLGRMAEGSSSKTIARRLGISHRTVEIHRSNILQKLDTETSVGAVRLCWDAENSN